MAKVSDAKKNKDTVEKLTKDVDTAILKVKVDSAASDKTTTAPGIHAGKAPKFGKKEFGV